MTDALDPPPLELYSRIRQSVSGTGPVVAIRSQYGDNEKDHLPFLESFLLLAEELRKRDYQVVLLPSIEVPDSFRARLNGIPLFSFPKERLVEPYQPGEFCSVLQGNGGAVGDAQ